METRHAFLKALENRMPQNIQSLFNIRENKQNLRGKNKLVLPVAKTTTYGLKSTCYIAAKAWNALPDNLRSVAEFAHHRHRHRHHHHHHYPLLKIQEGTLLS